MALRKLSKSEENLAKARAKRAGRAYPNPIDRSAVIRAGSTRRGK